jgi:hypothetical protein
LGGYSLGFFPVKSVLSRWVKMSACMQTSDNPIPTILLEHLHEWFSLVNGTSGPFILEGHLTPDYYLHFLLDELPLLLEDIPLQASLKLVAAPHFILQVIWYLNWCYRNCQIVRGGLHSWLTHLPEIAYTR